MISAANSSPFALPAQTAGAGGASAGRRATTFDAKAQAAADQKLSELRDTVAKLKTVGNSAASSTSEMARKKLDALKQRLKMLMMMGGDPKMVAKEAAKIAKEIGKVAKDYADAAGGSDSSAAADAASATATAQQAAASAASGDAEASGQAAGDPTADPSAAAPDGAGGKAGAADGDGAEPPKSDGTPTDSKQAQPQAPGPAPATAAHGGSSKSKLPDAVIEEARALEASAQAIAKAALQKLKAQHKFNPDEKKEREELEQGQKDFTAASKEIYGDTGEPSGSSSGYSDQGEAVAAPAAPAPPAVSLRA